MERILVTGGGGFVRSHLARHLFMQGHLVSARVNSRTPARPKSTFRLGLVEEVGGTI